MEVHLKHNLTFLLVILFVSVAINGYSQDRKPKNKTIYLTDGSVLKGSIIEDNEYFIRMVIETGDTLQIGYKNILDNPEIQKIKQEREPSFYLEDGLFYDIGLRGELRNNFIGALFGRIGKRLNSKWQLGLEAGYISREENLVIAIFENDYAHLNPYIKYYINQGKPRFFIYGSGGYSFGVSTSGDQPFNREDHDGGVIAFAGTGVHFAGRKKVRWMIELGASYHEVSGQIMSIDPWVGEVTTNYSREYLSPTVGVSIQF